MRDGEVRVNHVVCPYLYGKDKVKAENKTRHDAVVYDTNFRCKTLQELETNVTHRCKEFPVIPRNASFRKGSDPSH